jgi:hypothetical protein
VLEVGFLFLRIPQEDGVDMEEISRPNAVVLSASGGPPPQNLNLSLILRNDLVFQLQPNPGLRPSPPLIH